MLRVLLPINIDRWQNPITSLLREVAIRNEGFRFFSFSGPETLEDKELGKEFWNLGHVCRLRWLWDILFKRFDIVHCASATEKNFLAARLAQMRGATYVFTANIQPHLGDCYLKWYKRSLEVCDILVAVSQAVACDVESIFGRKVDDVIPNGVDIHFFSQEAAKTIANELGIRKPYVLFCGVLTQRKRPDIFLKLAKKMPEVDFVMVGGLYRQEEATRYLNEASGLENVKYLGRQPRSTVRDLMAEASALIFPSEIEGLPLTVLEALSMGLPVLAQPRSSLPEVVIPGRTGWLIDGESLDEWKDRVEQVLRWDSEKRKEFTEQARRFVMENFSWDVVAFRYRSLYLKVLEGRK